MKHIYTLLFFVVAFKCLGQTNTSAWHYIFPPNSNVSDKSPISIATRNGHLISYLPNTGGYFTLAKSDTFGNFFWKRAFYPVGGVYDSILNSEPSIVEHPNGQIAILTGLGNLSGTQQDRMLLMLFNPDGQLMNSYGYSIQARYKLNISVDENNNYSISTGNYTTVGFRLSFIKLSPNGIFVSGKEVVSLFPDSFKIGYYESEAQFKNGRIVTFGAGDLGNTNWLGLLRLNKKDEIMACRFMRKPAFLSYAGSIRKLSENRYVMSSSNVKTPIMVDSEKASSIFGIDTNLNVLWSHKFSGADDTSGLYGFYYPVVSYVQNKKLYAFSYVGSQRFMVDSNGVLTNQKSYEDGTLNSASYTGSHIPLPMVGQSPYLTSNFRGSYTKNFTRLNPEDSSFRCYPVPSSLKFLADSLQQVVGNVVTQNIVSLPRIALTNLADSSIRICRYDGFCPGNYRRLSESGSCRFPVITNNLINKLYFDEKIRWSHGDTTYSPTFPDTGKYYVTITSPCFTHRDSFNLRQRVLNHTINTDFQSVCSGDSLTFYGSGFVGNSIFYSNIGKQRIEGTRIQEVKFRWDTVSTQAFIPAKVYYDYTSSSVPGSTSRCRTLDSAEINIIPQYPRKLTDSLILCNGKDTLLNAFVSYPGFSSVWKMPNGDTTLGAVLVRQTGKYGLRLQRGGCTQNDSTFLKFQSSEGSWQALLNDLLFSGTGDTIFLKNTSRFTLQPSEIARNVRWTQANSGSFYSSLPTLNFVISSDTIIHLKLEYFSINNPVNDKACAISAIIKRVFIFEKGEPNFPNLLIVNGDGLNEKLTSLKFMPNNGKLLVFNRWGKQVFKKENYTGNWPEADIHNGTYFYHFESPNQVLKGWVQIIKD